MVNCRAASLFLTFLALTAAAVYLGMKNDEPADTAEYTKQLTTLKAAAEKAFRAAIWTPPGPRAVG